MQNQKSKPSAELPPEVRRLRAFINVANDTQIAALRFAHLSMAQMIWAFGWNTLPILPWTNRQSHSQIGVNRRLKLVRSIQRYGGIPYRVMSDLSHFVTKPQWDIYLKPEQREILYGPET